ncbi:MAG: UDP-N-acetylglucosamine 1-carboxyvinyltransferase [Bacteroidetes bacterium]|nr:UDP-N-acetylglucosamine 1-carboxyvinyltransferase [Bacteroidota bacterium]MCW5894674.1 UDP-N-acetylglucosamine 1-carboxyvinyltransferase [Bacteroidota bacterium]
MDKFIIRGGKKLSGRVRIGGAKNASLALMPATLLAGGTFHLSNTPNLRDVATMSSLLKSMGMKIDLNDDVLTLDTRGVNKHEAPYAHVKKMRASIYVLGPLIARYGKAKVSLPGGCAWGPRPVNLHVEGMKKLGAEIKLERGYIVAKAKQLTGAKIHFDISSVGATGNLLMAAVLAKGTTVIINAAIEPEITALAEFLVRMGAKIDGIGTNRLEIEGVVELHPADFETIPDRIEAGTFLVAAAITGGTVTLEHVNPEHFSAVGEKLEDAGCTTGVLGSAFELRAPDQLKPVDATAVIYPGFPTDMQAQWIALMSVANGTSIVTDTIYTDRFKHVPELERLGADIELKKNAAIIRGVKKLTGATVMSTDLRASASLILAGLVAEGETEVLRVYHLDRGYEAIEKKLRAIGADIERISGKEY